MAHRLIEFDEKTDQMLTEIAESFDGDISKALTELVHAHKSLEDFMDHCESMHQSSLIAQVNRAEKGFREGHFTAWNEIKDRNGL